MLEVGFVGLGRVVVEQRFIAVGVGGIEAVELGQYHGLYHREALVGPVFQVPIRLLAVEPVKKLPGGIAQPEKGLAVGGLEVPLVVAHPELRPAGTRQYVQQDQGKK